MNLLISPRLREVSSRIFFCVLIVIIGFMVFSGCISQNSTTPPITQNPSPVSNISEIIKNPLVFNKTEVTVRGKIINECGSGCWFFLSDESGIIFVDLSQNSFAIPQLQGTTVRVEGTIHVSGGDVILFARKVITDAGTYP